MAGTVAAGLVAGVLQLLVSRQPGLAPEASCLRRFRIIAMASFTCFTAEPGRASRSASDMATTRCSSAMACSSALSFRCVTSASQLGGVRFLGCLERISRDARSSV